MPSLTMFPLSTLQFYAPLLLTVDKQEAIGLALLCNERSLNQPSWQPPEPTCTQVNVAKRKREKRVFRDPIDL